MSRHIPIPTCTQTGSCTDGIKAGGLNVEQSTICGEREAQEVTRGR